MTKIKIPYFENQNKPILHALSAIKEYDNLNLAEVGVLSSTFYSMQDIYYTVKTKNVAQLLHALQAAGFEYALVEGSVP